VKPECESQGKGIFLTRNIEKIINSDNTVAQEYLKQPYLLQGVKFDLRIYVLLYGINPLKIYLFKDGLARFATKNYQIPNKQNIKDVFMHLTNYAINKLSPDYICCQTQDGSGDSHKRSLT
jgi:tubulin polyglutamylase TTLL6/13